MYFGKKDEEIEYLEWEKKSQISKKINDLQN